MPAVLTKPKKKTKKSGKLPNTLSGLILCALKDLEACERSKKYEISMDDWYSPNKVKKKCSVCLAGACIAQRLGDGPTCRSPEYFNAVTCYKLHAVNQMRCGYVENARCDLEKAGLSCKPIPEKLKFVLIPMYSRSNPGPFKQAILKLARDLKKAGL